jgi:hypothetical protein
MVRITFFLLSIFSLPIAVQAQPSPHHSDVAEYGFHGAVRTVTQYRFYGDSVLLKDSANIMIRAGRGYEYKRVYHFNPKGTIDSVVTHYPYISPVSKEVVPIVNFMVYTKDQSGYNTGFKFYTGNKELHDDGELEWKDSLHYVQRNYQFTVEGKKRTLVEETKFTLTPSFRELSYEVKTFGILNSKELSHYIVKNSIDSNGFLAKKRVEYLGNDPGWDETIYRINQVDRHGNPAETVMKGPYTNYLKGFILSEYTYYDEK